MLLALLCRPLAGGCRIQSTLRLARVRMRGGSGGTGGGRRAAASASARRPVPVGRFVGGSCVSRVDCLGSIRWRDPFGRSCRRRQQPPPPPAALIEERANRGTGRGEWGGQPRPARVKSISASAELRMGRDPPFDRRERGGYFWERKSISIRWGRAGSTNVNPDDVAGAGGRFAVVLADREKKGPAGRRRVASLSAKAKAPAGRRRSRPVRIGGCWRARARV